ncbi:MULTISPECIES: hypothetical protein [unclassified Pseudomonas]|uniref:hypothetical protein n=1 Tax=unclassified Pseudomonas TaxID=196821 RepID=UPI002B2306F6|nr:MULTISPECIES: hypothetical protein [unclassified Pseudomonas]MEA9979322.1 hypothetical protein [Pseudomonas sp. RTS4]MEB0197911.1 hypothetical protein [Pseudomonas sp. 5S4]MEB0246403.1 hypothetical protein [Pseudomonas sp. 10S5]
MTINIAIATYDAIVLGCDSLSSIVEQAVLPFRCGQDGFARDAQGNELVDAFGNKVVSVAQIQPFVTNVFGGAQKMFLLYEDDDTSVAAVTAGMATLSGVTIASVAARFRKKNLAEQITFTSVHAVAEAFLGHARTEWERQLDYANAPEEQRPYFPDVQFIAGGYGKDDETSKVFKISVCNLRSEEQFVWQTRSGTCFGGQADFVERLLVGVDQRIVNGVMFKLMTEAAPRDARLASIFAEQLRAAGVEIPEGFQFDIPQEFIDLPWNDHVANIDFANLPTQYAVDLVELLVNIQSGMQRFANGVATVGGRTHVGVLKRGEKFVMLNEPKLHHNHTGYSHDL